MRLSLAAAAVVAAALVVIVCKGNKNDNAAPPVSKPVVPWMDEGGFDAYRTSRRFAQYNEAGYVATQELEHPDKVIEAERAAARRAAARGNRAATGATQPTRDRRMTTQEARVFDLLDDPSRYGNRYTGSTTRAAERAATQPDYYDRAFANPTTRPLSPEEFEKVRNGEWTLEALQQRVDQFVLHYDVAGTSAYCFQILHDSRDLSVHFMLDLDGTIYQTLDLKERAFHGSQSNDRSIGIEIANIGSYRTSGETQAPLQAWYKKDENGQTYISIPERRGGMNSQRTKPKILRPARNEAVVGEIQGGPQRMYDLTPQQYAALIKLTAALGDVFPKITLDYPKDANGKLITRTLDDIAWGKYQGVLGHYHVQSNKSDPGAAFQWDYVIDNAKRELAARKGASGLAKK